MNIFNKQIFGSDAEWFLAQSCAKKKEWIKKNTNQTNDVLIDEFIKAIRPDKDGECQGCKDKKNETVAKTVPTEVAESVTNIDASGDSPKGNNSVPRRSGNAKGK